MNAVLRVKVLRSKSKRMNKNENTDIFLFICHGHLNMMAPFKYIYHHLHHKYGQQKLYFAY